MAHHMPPIPSAVTIDSGRNLSSPHYLYVIGSEPVPCSSWCPLQPSLQIELR